MGRAARVYFQAAVVVLTLASASLAGCAEPQAALLAQQQQAANAPETGQSPVLYRARALFGTVVRERCRRAGRHAATTPASISVVPMIASNVTSAQRHYPIADDATIASLVSTAASAGWTGRHRIRATSARMAHAGCWPARSATRRPPRCRRASLRACWNRSPDIGP